jgi:hypothetical protein
MTQTDDWNVIDDEACVHRREYSFSKGAYATTMVFRGVDGLVVVSPGRGLGARDYDALREHGEVRALIPGWRSGASRHPRALPAEVAEPTENK